MQPSARNTMALAAAGVIVLGALVVASGIAKLSQPSAWIALSSIAVAIMLIAVRAFIPAYLLCLAALALVTTGIASTTEGSSAARGFAILTPPCAVALAGLSITPRRSVGAVVTVVGAILAGPIRSLFSDPFRDGSCADCRHSAFAVLGDNEVASVLLVVGGIAMVSGLALLIPVSDLRVAAVATALAAIPAIAESGVGQGVAAPLAVGIAALTGVIVAVGKLRRRGRLDEVERAPRTPDALVAALRRIFRDPSLEVRFLAASVGWVDASGRASPAPSKSRATTVIADGIRLEHRPTTKVAAVVAEGVPPQLVVSLEEQRLTAELASELRELADSRARVVQRADDERRRLERDLHDGAQQHLLALGFDLRRAIAATTQPEVRVALEGCMALTTEALDDMRDIAHGIYPPLLAVAGLPSGLRSIPGVTHLELEVDRRFPTSVERLAYLVVEDLARGADNGVTVSARVGGAKLVVDIVGATTEPGPLIHERVQALSGTLEHGAHTWRLETPCG